MAEAEPGHKPGAPGAPLLRNHQGGPAPVSFLELFLDLVYVFAVTQVSHFILEHPGAGGLIEGGVIFAAIWWAWVYTTWAANWADPERLPVRLMLLAVMFASLLMSVAIVHAFDAGAGDQALLFAGAYVAIQIGRTLFMAWAMRGDNEFSTRNMIRIALWFCLSAVLWITGALQADLQQRVLWWLGAILLEYAGPIAGYYVPGLGRSSTREWNISGSHMAERCALFIIIALGEGIVVTGATYSETPMQGLQTQAFLLAFLSSVLMWWLYFDVGARRGAQHIEHHGEPGRIARNAYTYLHMPIVFGIVLTAVSDEMLLAHPERSAEPRLVLFLCGGLAVYLVGTGLFKRFSNPFRNFPWSHSGGLVLLAGAAAWGLIERPGALALGSVCVGILALIAAWEWGSFHGGWRERLIRSGAVHT